MVSSKYLILLLMKVFLLNSTHAKCVQSNWNLHEMRWGNWKLEITMKLLDDADNIIMFLLCCFDGKSEKYSIFIFWSDKFSLSPNSKKINKLEFEQNSSHFWRKTFSNKLEWKIDWVERLQEYPWIWTSKTFMVLNIQAKF